MKSSEPLIVAIKEAYRNHPLLGGPNVKLVQWSDKQAINEADIFLQSNILEQKRQKKLGHIYEFILQPKLFQSLHTILCHHLTNLHLYYFYSTQSFLIYIFQ